MADFVSDNEAKVDGNIGISYWQSKPIWCQPWTILLTGITINLFSLKFIPFKIVSFSILFLTIFWWLLFLLVVPQAYKKMMIDDL